MPPSVATAGRRPILVVVACLTAIGAGMWLALPSPADPAALVGPPVLGMAVLVAVSVRARFHLGIGQGSSRVTLVEFAFTLGLFLLAPTQQLVAHGLGVALVFAVLDRRSFTRTAFAVTQAWTATGAGLLVFHFVAGADAPSTAPATWAAAIGAATTAAIVSGLLVSHATALSNGRTGFQRPSESVAAAAVASLGSASLGLLVLAILRLAPSALVLLGIPAVTLVVAMRGNQRRQATNRSLALLHSISQSLATEDDLDRGLAELADAIRSGMDVRVSTVVLAAGSDDPPTAGIVARAAHGERRSVVHRSLTVPERETITGRQSSDGSADDGDSAQHLRDGLALSSRALVAPLRSGTRPLGFIAVDGRPGDLDGLTSDDRELLVAVATQLSTSLTTLRLEQSLTELHRLQDVLRHRADHDPLTGLSNRARFLTELDGELRRSPRTTAVLFLDLDDFKDINDAYGHHVGDELLRAVAGRLRAATKTSDVVARIGGDEFAVLLRDVDQTRANDVGERLADLVAEPFELDTGPVHVETSVGVALRLDDGPTSAATLLRNADAAMYAAKRDGQRRSRAFEQTMDAPTRDRLLQRTDIERGMTFDEFLVLLQPMVDLSTGQLVGAESLVRWGHPDRGLLPPVTFLELADEAGLMRQLGHRVIRLSCLVASEWPDHTTLSINISQSQLVADDRLVPEIEAAVRDAGIAPSRLLLDVTELAISTNPTRAARRLEELASVGVRIALDDFGTGSSSLEHVARLPLHALKIAAPFVAAIDGDDPPTDRIAQGIVRMAQSLGLDTIAEGIERPEQVMRLREWGCHLGQGYLLGRPMFATDLQSLGGWSSTPGAAPTVTGVAWAER